MDLHSADMPLARAQHIGSLTRPTKLLTARMAFMKGEDSAEQLEKATREAIISAVELQRELHFQEITDGEYRSAPPQVFHFSVCPSELLTCLVYVAAQSFTKVFSSLLTG
jgi:hypothetical protein